ncbi:MAG: hypothetical protein QOH84_4372, partial [Kribbellaceae bacterium]|nr:hypothetical protein [Kribbellaceae bacterium]
MSVRRPPGRRLRRTGVVLTAAFALVSAAASIAPASATVPIATAPTATVPTATVPTALATKVPTAKSPVPAKYPQLAAKPYMGWSSWSLQSTNYPGVNPDGPGSFISEKNILAQAKALATKLKPYGYEYINVDAGWQGGGDEYGRPIASPARFP